MQKKTSNRPWMICTLKSGDWLIRRNANGWTVNYDGEHIVKYFARLVQAKEFIKKENAVNRTTNYNWYVSKFRNFTWIIYKSKSTDGWTLTTLYNASFVKHFPTLIRAKEYADDYNKKHGIEMGS